MDERTRGRQMIVSAVVLIAQLVGAMIVTFGASLVVRAEDFQETRPALFALVVGLAFSTGVYVTGWLALRARLLRGPTRTLVRVGGVLLGVYIPLLVALVVYGTIEPGNPFFLVSLLAGALGFQAPGWAGSQKSHA